jgi:hypothetical protein
MALTSLGLSDSNELGNHGNVLRRSRQRASKKIRLLGVSLLICMLGDPIQTP